MAHDARYAALWALLAIDDGMLAQEALQTVLARLAGEPDFGFRERHLASELCYGALRNEPRFAVMLSPFLKRPGKLPRPMVHCLHLALHSLFLMQGIPDHAAVDQCVRMVAAMYGKRLSGVANAVLRQVLRQREDLEDVAFYAGVCDGDRLAGLAAFHGIPLMVARLWERSYGMEPCLALMRRSQRRPWVGLRLNRHHQLADSLRPQLQEQCNAAGGEAFGRNAFAFPPGTVPEQVSGQSVDALVAQGLLSFQSAASQMVMAGLGLEQWQKPVWDCCAGYGGKSLWLLENDVPVSLCTDTSLPRVGHIAAQCARLGVSVPAVAAASAALPALRRWQGHILCDAPCSGLGVLARRPDLRRRFLRQSPFEAIARLQFELLRKISALLQPGSSLAYITCTLNPRENEGNMAELLKVFPALRIERQWQTPHDHPWLDGMYGCLLSRK